MLAAANRGWCTVRFYKRGLKFMSPESVAKTWLDYARKDFELASIESPPEGVLDLLCFHAQQGAEKALKAVLILHSGAAPRTHDIAILLERIEAFSVVPPAVR